KSVGFPAHGVKTIKSSNKEEKDRFLVKQYRINVIDRLLRKFLKEFKDHKPRKVNLMRTRVYKLCFYN
ncbi:MAG: hypothetical protein QW265_05720, partial [Candidatus Bathyarchaeia archaeon]